MPRWVLYHARSLAGSLALMKTPPIPVMRVTVAFSVLSNGSGSRSVGFGDSLFLGFFSEAFASETESALFSGAFVAEAGSRSWAWIQEMGRATSVKAVNAAFVLLYILRSLMRIGCRRGLQA